MTLKEIATTILDRRNSAASIVLQGEMRSKLGADGYQEALNRRWLMPNMESGELQLANHMSIVRDMEKIAAEPAPAASITEAAKPA